jgi:hypothetical protein
MQVLVVPVVSDGTLEDVGALALVGTFEGLVKESCDETGEGGGGGGGWRPPVSGLVNGFP